MYRRATMTLFQLLVACLALAVDETPEGGGRSTTRPQGFEVTVRSLTDTVRVLTDNLGGWRMERYFAADEYLVSAEDTFGPLVEVTRNADGRTTGILLARRYALEYFYADPGSPWSQKILYEPRSGEVLAVVVNPRGYGGVAETPIDNSMTATARSSPCEPQLRTCERAWLPPCYSTLWRKRDDAHTVA